MGNLENNGGSQTHPRQVLYFTLEGSVTQHEDGSLSAGPSVDYAFLNTESLKLESAGGLFLVCGDIYASSGGQRKVFARRLGFVQAIVDTDEKNTVFVSRYDNADPDVAQDNPILSTLASMLQECLAEPPAEETPRKLSKKERKAARLAAAAAAAEEDESEEEDEDEDEGSDDEEDEEEDEDEGSDDDEEEDDDDSEEDDSEEDEEDEPAPKKKSKASRKPAKKAPVKKVKKTMKKGKNHR